MLAATGAGGLMAVAPTSLRANDEARSTSKELRGNSPVYRFRVGKIEAVSIVTGYLHIRPDKPSGLSDAEYQAAVADFDYPGQLRLDYNVLLLRTGNETSSSTPAQVLRRWPSTT
jgi:hypothetical protein